MWGAGRLLESFAGRAVRFAGIGVLLVRDRNSHFIIAYCILVGFCSEVIPLQAWACPVVYRGVSNLIVTGLWFWASTLIREAAGCAGSGRFGRPAARFFGNQQHPPLEIHF